MDVVVFVVAFFKLQIMLNQAQQKRKAHNSPIVKNNVCDATFKIQVKVLIEWS